MKAMREGLWIGGAIFGVQIARAFNVHHHERASLVVASATAVWFFGGLVCDNLLFKKEIAAEKQRLAERRAVVRAAKYAAALERARNEPPSHQAVRFVATDSDDTHRDLA